MSVKFKFDMPPEAEVIFNQDALKFLESLHNKFDGRIKEVLETRVQRQEKFNNGLLPDFLPETEAIRSSDWRVRDIPNDLLDRRVEITGPVDRKMVINALNADVKVFICLLYTSPSPRD